MQLHPNGMLSISQILTANPHDYTSTTSYVLQVNWVACSNTGNLHQRTQLNTGHLDSSFKYQTALPFFT